MSSETAPRRSTRLKTKSVAIDSEDVTETALQDDGDFVEPVRKKKKASRSKKAGGDSEADASSTAPEANAQPVQKRKAGRLAMLPAMPLDVLYEIFRNLPPYDLLRLARTTKSLRMVLLNRNARSVWVDALQAVPGLPPCPEDLSEPAYTRLAFDTHCSFCGGMGAQGTLWVWRLRTCRKCLDDAVNPNYLDEDETSSLFLTRILDDDLQTLVHSVRVREHFKTKHWAEMRYLRSEVNEVRSALDVVRGRSPMEMVLYSQERKRQLARVQEHAGKCHKWAMGAKTDRADELQLARRSRKEDIISNLRDLGFEHELEFINSDYTERLEFNRHPHVRVSKALTPRIWNNIKEDMVSHLRKVRTARLAVLRRTVLQRRVGMLTELYHNRRNSSTSNPAWPQLSDVCRMQPFTNLLDLPIPEAVSLDTATKESFQDAFDSHLPQVEADWSNQCSKLLASLLDTPSSASELASDESQIQTTPAAEDPHAEAASLSRLNLAAAVFKCNQCHKQRDRVCVRGAREMMQHYCSLPHIYSLPENCSLDLVIRQRIPSRPWNDDDTIIVDTEAVQAVKEIMALCGKDLETTTHSEMTELDARFACKLCSSRSRYAYPWQNAVTHTLISHPSVGVAMERLEPEEERTAKELEASQSFESYSYNLPSGSDWGCALCDDLVDKTTYPVRYHLGDKHDVKAAMRRHVRYTSNRHWKPPFEAVSLPLPPADEPSREREEHHHE